MIVCVHSINHRLKEGFSLRLVIKKCATYAAKANCLIIFIKEFSMIILYTINIARKCGGHRFVHGHVLPQLYNLQKGIS